MDVRELVTTHYAAGDLSEAILDALEGAGVDTENLEPDDLFPVDQLHAGGVAATRYALERLEVGPGTRLLDVGCGIGGPSRLAATYDAQVTGIDLTPEFVDAATTLTERVGLSETASFVATPGEALPFDAGLVRRRPDGARRHEHPRQAALFARGPPGAGTRRTLRGLRPDAHRGRSAPLPDAVGRGPAILVRGDRQ